MASISELGDQYQALHRGQMRFRRWLSLQRRQLREAWTVFSRNRLAVLGVALILLFALMSVAHPLLMATAWSKGVYDPQVGYDLDIFVHPSPPSPAHLLGTDTLGRDVLSRLLAATTPTFILALAAALTTAVLGTLSGALSVYFGGFLETILVHLSDVFLMAPAPLVMVVIGGTIEISPLTFGLLYGLIAGLGGAAIVLRAQALSIVHKPFIEAARVAGASGWQVVFTHLVPNMLPLAMVQMLVSVTGAVFSDGFSTFLGLSRTRLNWGSMIYDSFTFQAVNSTITWNVLIPSALAISLFPAAFYMIARGVHEVTEPRLRSNGGKLKARRKVQFKEKPVTLEDTAPVKVLRRFPVRLDDTAAFAWLEHLAVGQGAVEGLLLPAGQRRTSPPDWVQTGGEYPPAQQDTVSELESAYLELRQARQAMQQGDPLQAITAYQELIRSGQLLPEVVEDLLQALERSPENLALWQTLGDARLRQGDYQRALKAYEKAEGLL